jgi:hypothetical protein
MARSLTTAKRVSLAPSHRRHLRVFSPVAMIDPTKRNEQRFGAPAGRERRECDQLSPRGPQTRLGTQTTAQRRGRWARAGLTARGVRYILIGLVAILVALGRTSQRADQKGALQLLAGQPYGLVAPWLLGIGFAGYALWRLGEAAFGVTVDGPGAGPRLKSLARGLIYAGFSYLTFKVITDTQGRGHRKG